MSLAQHEFDFIRTYVRNRAGIVLETGKEYLVEARISGLMRQEKIPSISALIDRLRSNPSDILHTRVVEVMTTNETSFFRDSHPFEALRLNIMPAIIAARQIEKSISIWCGAASAGQEPYTIMMMLLEHFPQIASWKFSFVCTDISSEMIAKCKVAKYTQFEVNRGLPPAYLAKYFDKVGTDFQVKPHVRNMIQFREQNLLQPWQNLASLDIVFMRNVLIYFDSATKRDILARIRKILRPDGYLFLGSAETTVSLDDEYERMPLDRSSCYRKKTAGQKLAA